MAQARVTRPSHRPRPLPVQQPAFLRFPAPVLLLPVHRGSSPETLLCHGKFCSWKMPGAGARRGGSQVSLEQPSAPCLFCWPVPAARRLRAMAEQSAAARPPCQTRLPAQSLGGFLAGYIWNGLCFYNHLSATLSFLFLHSQHYSRIVPPLFPPRSFKPASTGEHPKPFRGCPARSPPAQSPRPIHLLLQSPLVLRTRASHRHGAHGQQEPQAERRGRGVGAALITLPRVPSFWHSSSSLRGFLAWGCALGCSDGDLERDQNLPARCRQPRLTTIALDIAISLPALVLCQLPGDFTGREALSPLVHRT